MKAAIVRKHGEINVEEAPVPEIQEGEALIKVKYNGICGSDLHVMAGEHKTAALPVIMGHEFVGELADFKSKEAVDLKVGDHVAAQPYNSCRTCEACITGLENVCSKLSIIGVHENGGFAEYVKVPLRKVFRLPEEMDLKLAALIEPLAVAVHDVRQSNFLVGQSAFVIGGGPIGILIALVARLSGASKVVISEINEYRSNFARELGFQVINPAEEDAAAAALLMTQGKGFDAVYEVSGTAPGAALMTKVCKTGGKVVIVGVPTQPVLVDTIDVFSRQLNIIGVRIHSQLNFGAAIGIIESGVIDEALEKFITKVYKLDDVKEAMDYSYNDKEHFKVLLQVY